MGPVFFKLMLWSCMLLPECQPTWKATYSHIDQCQAAAVILSQQTGQVTACVPYRVKTKR